MVTTMGQKSDRTVKRMIKEAKKYYIDVNPRWLGIKQVEKALEEFHPLRMENVIT